MTTNPAAVTNPAIPQLRTRVRPPALPTQDAPPADGVTLSAAPAVQQVAPPNGVVAQIARDQHSVALKATLPALPGGLLAAPVQLDILEGPEPRVSASVNGVALQGMRYAEDGRYYFYAQPGETMIVFDPQTWGYGLSAPFEPLAEGGYGRDRMEIVHGDGSRSFIHNDVLKDDGKTGKEHSFTRVDYRGGHLEAYKVVDRGGRGEGGLKEFGSSLLRWSTGKGLGYEVTPCEARIIDGGRIEVTRSTSLKKQWDVYKRGWNAGTDMLTGLLGGGNAPEILTPFSAELARPVEAAPAAPATPLPGLDPGAPPRQSAAPQPRADASWEQMLGGWIQ